ncbi:hypothetical protein COS81_00490 [candidate division WWE3 bacterium CG06_land_8_20_14_3_00_42_16]|uniref:Uncharacterized protein n=2 Tax=Katanobacteria TaxID=422282 RepID=A0A2M7APL3_UNCKA|nr:MAG: hypothetical protein COS81_00490 [candidate division WWE3 bacterium CG06_land_8_20_14_3_00_42_16]PJC69278.1 MAG: hypothetical protein CO015_00955 [candidate division WWE3 bacterium CG_4_8_14_3_um_filter_42_11]
MSGINLLLFTKMQMLTAREGLPIGKWRTVRENRPPVTRLAIYTIQESWCLHPNRDWERERMGAKK